MAIFGKPTAYYPLKGQSLVRDLQVWFDVSAAAAMVIFVYLELWPGCMRPDAFARRLRWMTMCRGVSRMTLLGIGFAILILMIAIAKIQWPYPVRRWVPEAESGLTFTFVVGSILARLTAPRLERHGRVITLQRDEERLLSIHMRPAGTRKVFNQTYLAKPNHIYLVTGFLSEYRDNLRALGWHDVEVLSPDVSAEMVGREKFVRHVVTQLPGWRIAFVGARRMRPLRRMAYLTAQRKKTSDGCERGVILSLN
jgi:hypothetical protein